MRMLTVLLLICVGLLPAPSWAVVTWFDTDFETCTAATGNDFPCEGWDDFATEGVGIPPNIQAGLTVIQSSTAAFRGNKGVRGIHDNKGTPGVEGGNSRKPSIYHSTPAGTKYFFARWAFHEAPGFEYCAINGYTKLVRFNGNGNPKVWISNREGFYIIGVEAPYDAAGTTDIYNTGVRVGTSDTVWQQIEFEWKLNTPGSYDGHMRLWIDNTLRVEKLNRAWVGPTPTSTGLHHSILTPSTLTINTMQLYMQCGLGTMYYDRIAMGPTRIGMVGGSPPLDTTPPSTPTLIASASGGGQGNPSWTVSTDGGGSGLSGYELERCAGAACTNFTLVTTTAASTLFYTDLTLAPSTTYRYRVKAFDGAGNRSPVSTIVNITTTSTFTSVLGTPDAFNRADNTDLGAAYDAGYTAQGPAQIVSNRVRPTTVNTRAYETFNTVTPGNDQWGQLTLSTLAGAQLADVCVPIRAANAATVTSYAGCAVKNGANTLEIREYTTGTPVVLAGNATYTPTTADKIRVEAEGTTLRLYLIRGTQEILAVSTTDASIAGGKVGVSMFVATSGSLANVEADDLVVGDFGAGASSGITFDSLSESPENRTAASTSWTHTVGSGANRWLGVCLVSRSSTAPPTVASSVTVGGSTITSLPAVTITGGGATFSAQYFYQTNPNIGANTIVATWASAPTDFSVARAISLFGVDQTSPIDAQSGSSGASTTPSTTITTVANLAAVLDCALGRTNAGLTVGAGQTMRSDTIVGGNQDGVGVSTVLGKTPAGAEVMDWTQGTAEEWVVKAVSLLPATVTPVVPPTIASLTLSPTGATLTAGTTAPTRMRIASGNNAGTLSYTDNVPWSTSYTHTWAAGSEFACFFPIDSAGVENTASTAYQCRTLTGIAPPVDTTPIVMVQTAPSGTLNQGTTSTVFAISLSKAGTCYWATTNTTYDLMVAGAGTVMTTASLSASANTGAILSNGTTTHVFTQCRFENTLGDDITTTTALDVSITVASGAPTDSTRPSTITNLAATALGQAQVSLVWPAATDANGVVSYNIYLCAGAGCTPATLAGSTGAVTQIVISLTPLLLYCFDVRGLDPSSNEGLASNVACVTTTAIIDLDPPSTMRNLRVTGGPFTSSVLLGWDEGSDSTSAITATIEQCAGAGCSDFVVVRSELSLEQLQVALTPGTLYRFRGIFTDQAGNRSLAYSNIVDVMTATSGLGRPRAELRFGTARESATRSAAGTRSVRP